MEFSRLFKKTYLIFKNGWRESVFLINLIDISILYLNKQINVLGFFLSILSPQNPDSGPGPSQLQPTGATPRHNPDSTTRVRPFRPARTVDPHLTEDIT